jgi:hypothetical protein
MTTSELNHLVPSAFADAPAPDVSERYQFIPTMPIVDTLLSKGWQIRSARQNSIKTDPYASHRIVFDVPGTPLHKEVGEVWPTATLFNSHNRTRRLSFSVGFFRTWCSNQAQISVLSADTSKIHILGFGGVNLDVIITDMMSEFAALPRTMDMMRATTLTPPLQLSLAKRCLSVRRYGDGEQHQLYTAQDAAVVLSPRRESDISNDLWTCYNRIQENILNGSKGGIQEVTQNRKINLGLWETALTFINN